MIDPQYQYRFQDGDSQTVPVDVCEAPRKQKHVLTRLFSLIGLAFKHSPTGKMTTREICKFIMNYSPYYRNSTMVCLRKNVQYHLNSRLCFIRGAKIVGKKVNWMINPLYQNRFQDDDFQLNHVEGSEIPRKPESDRPSPPIYFNDEDRDERSVMALEADDLSKTGEYLSDDQGVASSFSLPWAPPSCNIHHHACKQQETPVKAYEQTKLLRKKPKLELIAAGEASAKPKQFALGYNELMMEEKSPCKPVFSQLHSSSVICEGTEFPQSVIIDDLVYPYRLPEQQHLMVVQTSPPHDLSMEHALGNCSRSLFAEEISHESMEAAQKIAFPLSKKCPRIACLPEDTEIKGTTWADFKHSNEKLLPLPKLTFHGKNPHQSSGSLKNVSCDGTPTTCSPSSGCPPAAMPFLCQFTNFNANSESSANFNDSIVIREPETLEESLAISRYWMETSANPVKLRNGPNQFGPSIIRERSHQVFSTVQDGPIN